MTEVKVTIPDNSQNIVGVVTIKAPLDKVFDAHTDQTLFAQWWGRGNPMIVHRFRDGGGWHIVERTQDGSEHAFIGTYHEIAANERIVQTFEHLGTPERGHVFLECADFVAIDADTTEIRTLSTAQSQRDRDLMLASGMENGWRQSVEALGRLVEV